MKTPEKMSYAELRNIQREFAKPETSAEALILHGANLELRERRETRDGLITREEAAQEMAEEIYEDSDELSDRVEKCLS